MNNSTFMEIVLAGDAEVELHIGFMREDEFLWLMKLPGIKAKVQRMQNHWAFVLPPVVFNNTLIGHGVFITHIQLLFADQRLTQSLASPGSLSHGQAVEVRNGVIEFNINQ